MMQNSQFVTFLSSLTIDSVLVGVKIVFLIALLVYLVFAAVVVSQVKQMESMFVGGFEKPLGLLSWLHLGMVVLALLWALMVL